MAADSRTQHWTRRGLLAAGLSLPAIGTRAAGPEAFSTDVFVAGRDGYHTYRIPSLLVLPSGRLLAFCEGRKAGRGDSGDIDLLLKRSDDDGATWSPTAVAWDDGPNTVGNPCPVYDRRTGTIHLLLTRNLGEDTEAEIRDGTSRGTRECWVMTSRDEGVTWSPARNLTSAAKAVDWTWYATGPGVGIQLRSGRLLVPCDHMVAGSKAMRAHVIYSDDGGETWTTGGVPGDRTNECQAAELPDGTLYLNMRSYHGRGRRAVSRSADGGLTWSEVALDEALVEPVCQAGLVAVTTPGGPRLLFSNPASTRRERMTVRLSGDGGRTWPDSREVWAGPAAYSCPGQLPDGRLGLLYERGEQSPYERIVFSRFSLSWVLGG